MTATFGRLEQQTLTLEPGLNVIHAPNEWGKSTWCAFLVAMLYGIDTRERTKQGALADKERYAPWSGSPMSGRIDLVWQGRHITIERRTRGRLIFGEFIAYETQTGLPVPELTGDNCGQMLLGVEKSVFSRAGFIRLTDLPVTNDEALRRRLNGLVTTGDESGAGDDLAQKLKELKNRCRHNKTGLLPQLETQRGKLLEVLSQLTRLSESAQAMTQQRQALEQEQAALENHKTALIYRASLQDQRRVEEARAAVEAAIQQLAQQQAQCAALPDRQSAQEQIMNLEQLMLQWEALDTQPLPREPEKPEIPVYFSHMTPEQALTRAKCDKAAYEMLQKPLSPLALILAAAFLAGGLAVGFLASWLSAIPFGALGLFLVAAHLRNKKLQRRDRRAVADQYPGLSPEQWVSAAQNYLQDMEDYEALLAAYEAAKAKQEAQREALAENIACCTGGMGLQESLQQLRRALTRHENLQLAQERVFQARNHAETLAAMVKPAAAPSTEDTLTLSPEQTQQRLDQIHAQLHQLQLQLGQAEGKMAALGHRDTLEAQLAALEARIARAEDIYTAVTIAMQTLTDTANQLQRKFAPRITQRAQALFAQLTDGRYDRLLIDESFQVSAAAAEETTLHSGLWRSDGTADQQYLALRLAVAEALTPNAPLILDDALVRFDDIRLQKAIKILQAAAEEKQVILFTCQEREQKYL